MLFCPHTFPSSSLSPLHEPQFFMNFSCTGLSCGQQSFRIALLLQHGSSTGCWGASTLIPEAPSSFLTLVFTKLLISGFFLTFHSLSGIFSPLLNKLCQMYTLFLLSLSMPHSGVTGPIWNWLCWEWGSPNFASHRSLTASASTFTPAPNTAV